MQPSESPSAAASLDPASAHRPRSADIGDGPAPPARRVESPAGADGDPLASAVVNFDYADSYEPEAMDESFACDDSGANVSLSSVLQPTPQQTPLPPTPPHAGTGGGDDDDDDDDDDDEVVDDGKVVRHFGHADRGPQHAPMLWADRDLQDMHQAEKTRLRIAVRDAEQLLPPSHAAGTDDGGDDKSEDGGHFGVASAAVSAAAVFGRQPAPAAAQQSPALPVPFVAQPADITSDNGQALLTAAERTKTGFVKVLWPEEGSAVERTSLTRFTLRTKVRGAGTTPVYFVQKQKRCKRCMNPWLAGDVFCNEWVNTGDYTDQHHHAKCRRKRDAALAAHKKQVARDAAAAPAPANGDPEDGGPEDGGGEDGGGEDGADVAQPVPGVLPAAGVTYIMLVKDGKEWHPRHCPECAAPGKEPVLLRGEGYWYQGLPDYISSNGTTKAYCRRYTCPDSTKHRPIVLNNDAMLLQARTAGAALHPAVVRMPNKTEHTAGSKRRTGDIVDVEFLRKLVKTVVLDGSIAGATRILNEIVLKGRRLSNDDVAHMLLTYFAFVGGAPPTGLTTATLAEECSVLRIDTSFFIVRQVSVKAPQANADAVGKRVTIGGTLQTITGKSGAVLAVVLVPGKESFAEMKHSLEGLTPIVQQRFDDGLQQELWVDNRATFKDKLKAHFHQPTNHFVKEDGFHVMRRVMHVNADHPQRSRLCQGLKHIWSTCQDGTFTQVEDNVVSYDTGGLHAMFVHLMASLSTVPQPTPRKAGAHTGRDLVVAAMEYDNHRFDAYSRATFQKFAEESKKAGNGTIVWRSIMTKLLEQKFQLVMAIESLLGLLRDPRLLDTTAGTNVNEALHKWLRFRIRASAMRFPLFMLLVRIAAGIRSVAMLRKQARDVAAQANVGQDSAAQAKAANKKDDGAITEYMVHIDAQFDVNFKNTVRSFTEFQNLTAAAAERVAMDPAWSTFAMQGFVQSAADGAFSADERASVLDAVKRSAHSDAAQWAADVVVAHPHRTVVEVKRYIAREVRHAAATYQDHEQKLRALSGDDFDDDFDDDTADAAKGVAWDSLIVPCMYGGDPGEAYALQGAASAGGIVCRSIGGSTLSGDCVTPFIVTEKLITMADVRNARMGRFYWISFDCADAKKIRTIFVQTTRRSPLTASIVLQDGKEPPGGPYATVIDMIKDQQVVGIQAGLKDARTKAQRDFSVESRHANIALHDGAAHPVA
jgi:hypothetical protein